LGLTESLLIQRLFGVFMTLLSKWVPITDVIPAHFANQCSTKGVIS